ncbi:MAG: pitrilysin family protein, partial [Planctomycetota bacterium]
MRTTTSTVFLAAAAAAAAAAPAFADSTVATNDMADSVAIVVPDIDFTSETLDNGLRVIYAPMDNAPVVHVRVLYHVGSKDEQPDRQGFAHLFEHMMFRGSEHVASEEHMKRINGVGGSSNAFTSFDQTTYINTVPANALEMALWLEADRMASFNVDEEKFVTERSVVNEEFLQRVANPPYGRQFIDFFDLAFDASHYQWTPIGDMEQLSRSTTDELQAFFDTFYVPNNAVLAIAGDFEVDEARAMVRDYFGWMPSGGEIPRPSPMEPVQSQKKEKSVYVERAPLPALTLAFKTGGWGDDDV